MPRWWVRWWSRGILSGMRAWSAVYAESLGWRRESRRSWQVGLATGPAAWVGQLSVVWFPVIRSGKSNHLVRDRKCRKRIRPCSAWPEKSRPTFDAGTRATRGIARRSSRRPSRAVGERVTVVADLKGILPISGGLADAGEQVLQDILHAYSLLSRRALVPSNRAKTACTRPSQFTIRPNKRQDRNISEIGYP